MQVVVIWASSFIVLKRGDRKSLLFGETSMSLERGDAGSPSLTFSRSSVSEEELLHSAGCDLRDALLSFDCKMHSPVVVSRMQRLYHHMHSDSLVILMKTWSLKLRLRRSDRSSFTAAVSCVYWRHSNKTCWRGGGAYLNVYSILFVLTCTILSVLLCCSVGGAWDLRCSLI